MDKKFNREFRQFCYPAPPELERHVKLWQAVIKQQFDDAFLISRKKKPRYIIHEAIRWLLEGKQDFYDVCDSACVDPVLIRKKAKELLQQCDQTVVKIERPVFEIILDSLNNYSSLNPILTSSISDSPLLPIQAI